MHVAQAGIRRQAGIGREVEQWAKGIKRKVRPIRRKVSDLNKKEKMRESWVLININTAYTMGWLETPPPPLFVQSPVLLN